MQRSKQSVGWHKHSYKHLDNQDLKKRKLLLIPLFMLILITVPRYGIYAQPSLLGKLKKYKKGHLKFYIITLNVTMEVF